ncbi:MAG: hypothetical protein JNN01_08950 [Opitutaceae bacterium]|nr:hypothetical protein [Opitutaceae bacterium]
MPSPQPVNPRASQERMAGRIARLRMQGDEAPMRFGLIGAVVGAGLAAVTPFARAGWTLALGAAVGGLLGWLFGRSRQAIYRRREQQVSSMLDRVERNAGN